MVVPSGDTYICYPCNIKSLSSPINASIYDLTGFKLFLTFDKEHIVVALYQIVHQCIDAGGDDGAAALGATDSDEGAGRTADKLLLRVSGADEPDRDADDKCRFDAVFFDHTDGFIESGRSVSDGNDRAIEISAKGVHRCHGAGDAFLFGNSCDFRIGYAAEYLASEGMQGILIDPSFDHIHIGIDVAALGECFDTGSDSALAGLDEMPIVYVAGGVNHTRIDRHFFRCEVDVHDEWIDEIHTFIFDGLRALDEIHSVPPYS